MNNDGFLDIVIADTHGGITVYDHTGFFVVPWLNIRYSQLTAFASESSPVVADINGDWQARRHHGGREQEPRRAERHRHHAPGFPIVLNGEVRGTPAVCDCDGDGMSEIVLADWDRNLYMWDYDYPFSPGHTPPWPQFHHDAARTGFASTPCSSASATRRRSCPGRSSSMRRRPTRRAARRSRSTPCPRRPPARRTRSRCTTSGAAHPDAGARHGSRGKMVRHLESPHRGRQSSGGRPLLRAHHARLAGPIAQGGGSPLDCRRGRRPGPPRHSTRRVAA
jgi:hypothetical protein